MTRYHPDWVFNLILKFAVVVSLSTLALSLTVGVGPLTALLRSGAAFVAFAVLAWAASLVWEEIKIETEPEEETEAMTDPPETNNPRGTATRPSTVEQPTQPARPLTSSAETSLAQTTGDTLNNTMAAKPATASAVASRTE